MAFERFDPRTLIPLVATGLQPNGGGGFLKGWQRAQQQEEQRRQQDEQRTRLTRQDDRAQQELMLRADQQALLRQQEQLNAVNSIRQLLEDPTIDDPAVFDQRMQFANQFAPTLGVDPGFIQSLRPAPTVFQQRQARKKLAEIEKAYGAQQLGMLEADDQTGAAPVFEVGGERLTIAQLRERAGVGATMNGRPMSFRQQARPDVPNTPEEQFYQTWAKERGKAAFAELPTDEQTRARAKWTEAGREPDDSRIAGIQREIAELRLRSLQAQQGAGAITPAQASMARGFADDFTRDSKDYLTRLQAYQAIRQAATDPSAAGDLALIFSFMKMLDPGSTVREGEFANAQNAAGVPDQIRNAYNRAARGERLNPTQRADFARQAQAQFVQSQARQRGILKVYTDRATRARLNPADVVIDYDNVFGVDTSPITIGGAPNVPPSGGNPYRGGRASGAGAR